MKIKKGMTIAEVLIAMAVAGIVAAIMIPVIHRSKPNQEMIMVKKAYYLTSRVVNEMVNDDDLYPEEQFPLRDDSECEYKGQIYGGTGNPYTKFCRLFAAHMGVSDPSCNNPGFGAVNFNNPTFTTADGIQWVIGFDGGYEIYFDTNGARGANCLENCDNGPDQFQFTVGMDGEIWAGSEITRRYLSSTNVNKSYKEIMKD